jgi:hypothetical protein
MRFGSNDGTAKTLSERNTSVSLSSIKPHPASQLARERLAGSILGALGRAPIEPTFRHCRQLLVRRFLLIEGLLQHAGAVVPPKELSPSDQAAVAGYLVVLDGLCCGNERGIQNGTVLNFTRDVVRFLDDAINGRAIDPEWFGAVHLKDLFQPFDVIFRLAQMRF